jgi:hypothetical protein
MMRVFAVLLTVAGVAGCSNMQTSAEQGFVDEAGWRHQQVVLDADAIVRGMNEARTQSEIMAKRTSPGSATQ